MGTTQLVSLQGQMPQLNLHLDPTLVAARAVSALGWFGNSV